MFASYLVSKLIISIDSGHTEKIYFVKFHPIAENVLLSASYDMTIRLWDLIDGIAKISIEHPDQVQMII